MKDVADIDIQTEIKLYDNVETQTFVERVDSQGYFFSFRMTSYVCGEKFLSCRMVSLETVYF